MAARMMWGACYMGYSVLLDHALILIRFASELWAVVWDDGMRNAEEGDLYLLLILVEHNVLNNTTVQMVIM
jgi:hypothetical protein